MTLLRRIHADLGHPPMPSLREVLGAAFYVLVAVGVFLAMTVRDVT